MRAWIAVVVLSVVMLAPSLAPACDVVLGGSAVSYAAVTPLAVVAPTVVLSANPCLDSADVAVLAAPVVVRERVVRQRVRPFGRSLVVRQRIIVR